MYKLSFFMLFFHCLVNQHTVSIKNAQIHGRTVSHSWSTVVLKSHGSLFWREKMRHWITLMAKSLSTRETLGFYFVKMAPVSDSIISPLSAFVVSHFSSPVAVCVRGWLFLCFTAYAAALVFMCLCPRASCSQSVVIANVYVLLY